MRKYIKGMFLGLVLLFLYLPIFILAVYSFTDATNIGAIRGFSLHNYVTLFTTPELLGMIGGTILLALGARFCYPPWNNGRYRCLLFQKEDDKGDLHHESGAGS